MWIDPSELKKLEAEDVRKLPAGSRVILHGRDRHGEATQLECTVVQSGKKKKLIDVDWYGNRRERDIIRLDGVTRYYTTAEVDHGGGKGP